MSRVRQYATNYILVGAHIWGVQCHSHIWPSVTLKGQSQGHSDFEGLYLVKLGHMLQLDTTRKPYTGSPMTLSHLALSDLERSKSKWLRFPSIISRKSSRLRPNVTITHYRKAYIGSPLVRLHLNLETLKGQCQGHSDFEGLYLVKKLSYAIC